jgi:glycosyltransferase involved in cell wall biosynthesis
MNQNTAIALKILFLNHSDSSGGAARAAYRLMCALREQGYNIKMLVRDKQTNDPDVISCFDYKRKGFLGEFDHFIWKVKNRIRKQKWKKYPNREPVFLNDLDSISLIRAIKSIDFDILHLHFVSNRFLNLKELKKIDKPIVWTLHDSWAFTGICHYFYDCERYKNQCGNCPMLHSINKNDFTHKIWKIKNRVYQKLNLNIVTPSHWLGACAVQSSLLCTKQVDIIPNCIDTKIFKRIDKNKAKKALGLDLNTHYILFGAFNAEKDRNKGYHILINALKECNFESTKPIELLVFGNNNKMFIHELSLKIYNVGQIDQEDKLAQIYQAADVLVMPSLSENLSNIIMESMACGTPVVAFHIGGNADLIEHKQNGYLAKAFDSGDLCRGIEWCIENTMINLSENAFDKVNNTYTFEKISNHYIELYNKLLYE